MKVRENISGAVRRIREASLWRRIRESEPFRLFRRIWVLCNENPFPWQVLMVLLYRLALDVTYLVAISPAYTYTGFTRNLEPLLHIIQNLLYRSFLLGIMNIQILLVMLPVRSIMKLQIQLV